MYFLHFVSSLRFLWVVVNMIMDYLLINVFLLQLILQIKSPHHKETLKMNKFSKLLVLTLVATASSVAMADIAGQVDVKLNVSTGCQVGGSEVSGAINNFGTLNFGKTSGTWTNVLSAEVVGNGNGGKLEVVCEGTENVPFTVTVDGGIRGDRSLKNTSVDITTDNLVKYNVYRDAARNNAYVNNVAQDFETQGSQPQAIPLFGSIAPNTATAVAQGDYIDTLMVNVSF